MNDDTFAQMIEDRTPETVTESRIITISAKFLRQGDSYRVNSKRVDTVGSTKIGTKRVTVFNEAGKEIAYLPLWEQVKTVREVETDDSAAARKHVYRCLKIQRMAVEAEEAYANAVTYLNEGLAEFNVSPYAMTSVAEAAAEREIWQRVTMTAENSEEGIDEVGAAHQVANDILRDLLGYQLRGESRSTSQMSNLLEDIGNEARAKFARRWATAVTER